VHLLDDADVFGPDDAVWQVATVNEFGAGLCHGATPFAAMMSSGSAYMKKMNSAALRMMNRMSTGAMWSAFQSVHLCALPDRRRSHVVRQLQVVQVSRIALRLEWNKCEYELCKRVA